MKHLKDMTLEDLRAVAGDADALNRLCQQVERKEPPCTCTDSRWYVRASDERESVFQCSACKREGVWRDVYQYCRPDVGMDRLMGLMQAVREWTGRSVCLETFLYEDGGTPIRAAKCRSVGSGVSVEALDDFDGDLRLRRGYLHDAHAVILAVLSAAIVYGEAR